MTDKNNFSELTTLGMKFYEEKLKPILEPEHNGEFVAIEPYSERYFLDKNRTKVAVIARDEMPEKLFFFATVGTIHSASLSHYVRKQR